MEYHFQFLMNPELLDLKPLFAGASTSVPPGVSTHNPANCVSIYYIWSGKGTLYRDEQESARLGEDIKGKFYTIETGDHTEYIGQIVTAYIIEDDEE